jgi:aminoglycoside phosphotransferase (APT) family kinase protein
MTDVTRTAGDLTAAGEWLAEHVPGLDAPLRFRPIRGGHSNITVQVVGAGGRSVAVRRPPYGRHPRGAHDVVREAATIAALAGSGVPVPEVVAVCTDDSVIGSPFAVTAWIDGTVVGTPGEVDAALPDRAGRHRIADELITTLARLHATDPDRIGPARSATPYLERQLTRLTEVWSAVRTRDLPQVAELAGRLFDARPAAPRTGIVHADYRLGNCMIGGGRLLAVLDWELSARGDVLADLAYLLNNWEQPTDPEPSVWMQTPPTRAGGFPPRAALLERYTELTGVDTADVDYYRAFAAWRMAVIAEGVKHRYEAGAMADSDVDHGFLDRRVGGLLAQSDRHLRAFGA